MFRSVRWLASFALGALGCGATQGQPLSASQQAQQAAGASSGVGFVQRAGTGFTLDGKPFAVVGANTHYLNWGSQYEVDSCLQDYQKLGFTTVRLIVHGIKGSLDDKTVPTIWGWPNAADSSNMKMNGVYNVFWDTKTSGIAFNDGPDGFQKLDYVLKKAGELGLKLDIALMDFWHYAGGSQQMRAWYGSTGNLGNSGIPAPSGGPDQRYDFFFSDERTRADYKKLVTHILTRKNSLTGVAYKDDPTIFAWDLMNEPEFKTVELGTRWLTEMSAHVKSIDGNHLLSSGSEGFYGGGAGSDPDEHLAIPDIDFGTWHAYPAYHNVTPGAIVDLIERHSKTARKIGKPVIWQEFGYSFLNPDFVSVYRMWLKAANETKDSGGWLSWRLTSFMDGGKYPQDNGEHFDFHADDSPLAKVFADAARAKKEQLGSK